MSIAFITALSNRLRLRSDFTKQVLTLATGTAAAQVLTILAAPLLTRLYRPEDYGVFALFGAVVGLCALLASGKYDLAILIPKEDAAATALVGACLLITSVTAVALTVLLWFTCHPLAAWLGDPLLAPWLQLVPLGVVLTNLGLVLAVWANRQQAYGALSNSRMAGALAGTAANLALGFAGWGAAGLVCGFLVVQGTTLAVLWRHSSGLLRALKSETSLREIRAEAARFASFPKFSLGAELLNALSNQLVVFVLSKFFGMAVLGWYAMAQRMIGIPTALVGGAVGEVFRSQASRDYAERGECRDIFRRTFKRLALLGAGLFLVLLMFAPELFATGLGEDWRAAGELAVIMSGFFMFRFVCSPLSFLFFVAGRQRADFILTSYLLLSSVTILFLPKLMPALTFKVIIGWYSANYCLVYVITLLFSWRFSAGTVPAPLAVATKLP